MKLLLDTRVGMGLAISYHNLIGNTHGFARGGGGGWTGV